MTLSAAPLCRSFRSAGRAGLLAAATFALAVPALTAQTVSATSKNAAAAAPVSPYHGEVVEDIIARVNDQVISTSDYDRAEGELTGQAQQRNMSAADLDEQKRQLLRDLIDNQLLLSKGKQLGITGEAETIRQLDELRKQNNLDSMEALEKAAEQQGVSFADFKASIANRVITSQVIRDEVGRRISILPGDERAYYQQHPDQFTTPEQVKLSEILIPTGEGVADVAKAQTKADALEADLKAGKDFAALAKADSGGSTAADGGALGEFKRGQLAKVLEDDTFSLKPGEYTAPIQTKQGFVILKVDAHTPAGLEPFEQAQPQVEDAIGTQKMQPALRAYLTRLREEAYIDIKPGYVDSAASSNETRPIFSAYQPPAPKKKKTLQRTRFSGSARTRGAKSAPKSMAAAAPVPPTGVPSLADVPTSSADATQSAAGTGSQTAPATGAASAPATAAATPSSNQAQVAAAKPGKKEKVRFGQAPRESLPAADTRTQDAGASAANGNSSDAETALAADTAPGSATLGTQASGNNVSSNVRYANGQSAGDEQVAAPKTKTRFSQRPVVPKAVKADRKAKANADQYGPPDAQEIADKSQQDKPLGLKGDTSVKPPKPKPSGIKTRYSDEAGKKNEPELTSPGTGADAPPTPVAVTGQTTPVVTTKPYQEPSPQSPPGSDAPVTTQSTPTGSGDPLGPTVPAATPPANPPQR